MIPTVISKAEVRVCGLPVTDVIVRIDNQIVSFRLGPAYSSLADLGVKDEDTEIAVDIDLKDSRLSFRIPAPMYGMDQKLVPVIMLRAGTQVIGGPDADLPCVIVAVPRS